MTNLFCLDANVILKLLVKEDDSDQAEIIYTSKTTSFISSNFAKYEIFSTLRKKSTRKENSEEDIKIARNNFNNINVNFLEESDADINEAYNLAEKLNLPVIYDCLYLICAKKKNAGFVSADEAFIKQAKKVYIKSFSLKEVVGTIS